jgi:hypothetical protein
MTVCRALPFVAVIVVMPFAAGAQFGGMPGLPGGPPGRVPGGESFGGPPAGPPRVCQELMALRDETQKAGLAINSANQRKASVQEACRLFRSFLAAEMKFMKGIEEHGRTCGAPPDVVKQVKEGHAKASQIGNEVCKAAGEGSRLPGPSPIDVPGGPSPRERWPRGDYYIRDELQRFFGR